MSQEFTMIAILIAICICGRAALVMMGQRWVATFAHTATLTTLPIITYVITKVISGNIALSLGMIGALSIVRFRNPVKSPFELSVYFAAITLGISASVSPYWLIIFVGAMLIALAALVTVSFVAPHVVGRPYFEVSFSEGNRLSTLEVEARSPQPDLQNSKNLISESQRDGVFSYILATEKFSILQKNLRALENDASVIEARLNK